MVPLLERVITYILVTINVYVTGSVVYTSCGVNCVPRADTHVHLCICRGDNYTPVYLLWGQLYTNYTQISRPHSEANHVPTAEPAGDAQIYTRSPQKCVVWTRV